MSKKGKKNRFFFFQKKNLELRNLTEVQNICLNHDSFLGVFLLGWGEESIRFKGGKCAKNLNM